jgi:uncharacterized protein
MSLESEQALRIMQIAKELASPRPTHDWDHILRVLKLAHRIADKETRPVNRLVLDLAVFLHDVARQQEDDSNGEIDHVHEGIKLARKILQDEGYSELVIDEVCNCIQTHRFRKEKGDPQPRTVEAEILFDADKLDSIGAIGVARAFTYAGENRYSLYRDMPPDYGGKRQEINPLVHTPNIEFEVKLRRIKALLLTEEGRSIAVSRHAFMEQFFQRLRDEVKGRL